MSYRVTDKMSETGQFVAVWEYARLVWSDTFDIGTNGLRKYDKEQDKFVPSRQDHQAWGVSNPDVKNVVFIALEDK